VLTNDGNAILREIDVSHPAAKARRRGAAAAARVLRR
jgi:chaperonin GroEL (HSP60 family)